MIEFDTIPPPAPCPTGACIELLDAKIDRLLVGQTEILRALRALANEVAELHEFRRRLIQTREHAICPSAAPRP